MIFFFWNLGQLCNEIFDETPSQFWRNNSSPDKLWLSLSLLQSKFLIPSWTKNHTCCDGQWFPSKCALTDCQSVKIFVKVCSGRLWVHQNFLDYKISPSAIATDKPLFYTLLGMIFTSHLSSFRYIFESLEVDYSLFISNLPKSCVFVFTGV